MIKPNRTGGPVGPALTIPLAILMGICTAVAVVLAIVVTALLSPLLMLFSDQQPSKFYDYGNDNRRPSDRSDY